MSAVLGAKSDAGDILNVNTYFACLPNCARMEREKSFSVVFHVECNQLGGLVVTGRSIQCLRLPHSQVVPEASGERSGFCSWCLRDQKPSSGESLRDNNSNSFLTGSFTFWKDRPCVENEHVGLVIADSCSCADAQKSTYHFPSVINYRMQLMQI